MTDQTTQEAAERLEHIRKNLVTVMEWDLEDYREFYARDVTFLMELADAYLSLLANPPATVHTHSWEGIGFLRDTDGQVVVLQCRTCQEQQQVSWNEFAAGKFDPPATVSGQLKPLEWVYDGILDEHRAVTCFGTYSITGGHTVMWATGGTRSCDSIEHGKSLCVADYSSRVAALYVKGGG